MAGVGSDITDYLSEYHTTEEKAIKARDLRVLFNLGEKQVRNIVTELRQAGVPICSSSYGYWYSNNPEDIEKTVHRLQAQVNNMGNSIRGLDGILQEVKDEKENI